MKYVLENDQNEIQLVENTEQAAHKILTYDGRTSSIRPEEGGWRLWVSKHGGRYTHNPEASTAIFSTAEKPDEANADIFAQVVNSPDFVDPWEALPLADWIERREEFNWNNGIDDFKDDQLKAAIEFAARKDDDDETEAA